MPTYEVELRSPVDAQSRITSGEFDSPDAARAAAEASELDIVNFSLLPPEKDVWEQGTYVQPLEGGLGKRVNLSNWDAYHKPFAEYAAALPYGEAVSAAKRRLDDLTRQVEFDAQGKVRYHNLSHRALARLHGHNQTEPYEFAGVREVDQAEIDAQRLVMQIKAAKANPRAWALTLKKLRDQNIPLNAVTAALGGKGWQAQIDGSGVTVYSSGAIQCSLHTAYTFDNDTHDFFNDASGTEITGTGYTANGVTLASKTSNYTTGTDLIWLDAADPSWTTSTLSATDAVIWVNTAGASSTDPIWGNIDFGATVTTTAGTFLITLDATAGLVAFDVT